MKILSEFREIDWIKSLIRFMIILAALGILVLTGAVVYLDAKVSMNFEDWTPKTFEIEVVVPDQILVIKPVYGSMNHTNDFADGMREVSKNYIIRREMPVNKETWNLFGGGSKTAAIILFVEPKQN
jgi:hypothetical protein